MRAVVVTQYGSPDVLRVHEDVPEPVPGHGEVAVDVAYAGVNFAEVMARRGALPAVRPPFVPGLEVSGHVRSLGAGVTGLEVGQPVCALTIRGGYAEVVVVSASLTHALPAGLSATSPASAALPTIVPTAWALIHDVARLRRGETVLVHAAGGGLGTLVGQVARQAGAGRVVGVAGTAAKARYAARFGYDEIVHGADWADGARAAGGKRGFDVVVDSVGGEVRTASFELLAPLGRLLLCGNACGETEDDVPGRVLRTAVKATLGWSITALAAAEPERVAAITAAALAAVAAGGLTVDVTGVFPLAKAARAHTALEQRRSRGKLVLKVSGDGLGSGPSAAQAALGGVSL